MAPGTGWVRRIDRERIAAALPAEGIARLEVGVGDFVTPRTVAMRVHGGSTDVQPLAAGIHLGPTREPRLDLAFAIGQLVDVADHALAQPGADTATAREVLFYLGAVFERLLAEGLQPAHVRTRDGRLVLDGSFISTGQHLKLAVERLRQAAAREPLAARHLTQMLVKVRAAARAVPDEVTAAEADRQIDRLRGLAEAHGMDAADLAELEHLAATSP
jgi:uncharacterized membrane protein